MSNFFQPSSGGSVSIPRVFRYTSSTTHNVTAGTAFLKVYVRGGGAGGWGSGTTQGTSPVAGTASTFGGGSLVSAAGGAIAAAYNSFGGLGGTATITSPAIGTGEPGQAGGPSGYTNVNGGAYPGGGMGGGGTSGGSPTAGLGLGQSAVANTGRGGGGGAGPGNAASSSGAGGGQGALATAYIPNPSSSYAVVVGGGGAGGGAGTVGYAGGAGAAGEVIVEEY